MSDDVVAGCVVSRRRSRPYRKAIVASSPGGAVGDNGVLHGVIDIDAVGERITESATIHNEAAGIEDPRRSLGMFDPDP